MTNPATPKEAYQQIIDQLVSDTSQSVAASNVRERGIYSPAVDDAQLNRAIAECSPELREHIATALIEERRAAIHDVLAALTWWMDSRNVRLTYQGCHMPTDLGGMGMHGDFICRVQGWSWPEIAS